MESKSDLMALCSIERGYVVGFDRDLIWNLYNGIIHKRVAFISLKPDRTRLFSEVIVM